jgi:large subunit ribosomal protein L6
MSRIGKQPITLPAGVTVTPQGGGYLVKGQRGEIRVSAQEGVDVKVEKNAVTLTRQSDLPRHRARHGLARQLLSNAVHGVSAGFSKRLEVSGVGYRIALKGKALEMEIGFSHPVRYEPQPGITLGVEEKNIIVVAGADKQKVGQAAAEIRAIKPPDPYKAKGVRYSGEVIRRKVGKVGA